MTDTPYNHFRILSRVIKKHKVANEDLTAHGDEMIALQQFHESIEFDVVSHSITTINDDEVLFSIMVVGINRKKDLV